MDWHVSVVNEPVKILVLKEKPDEVLYQDEYQIIVDSKNIAEMLAIDLDTFNRGYYSKQ
jgi:hypothetical protein